ncbi:MAG: hypothetical protein RL238_2155 [Actinomycetota bacterium]|jgi:dienelactone hydrolase
MTALTAGAPIGTPTHPVGRRTVTLVDPARDGRRLDVDLWYPAAETGAERSVYEVFPGVAFEAAWAQHHPAVLPGRHPLVLFSHGRTGMRISYSMICEALAAHGMVVASADHPGDALADWLTAQQTDDRTNEVNRVADAHLVLDALLHGHPEVPLAVTEVVDHDRIAIAGHSYGAYTAFATAAGSRGVDPHEHVRAVIGFQPFIRTMSDRLLQRVEVPSLLVVSELDTTTPAHIDADRAWDLLPGRPSWRLDLAGCGHQAVSDIALYAELADHVEGLPQMVRDYLAFTAAGSTGPGTRPWRTVMAEQVDVAWAFLQVALDLDPSAGQHAADHFAAALHRR